MRWYPWTTELTNLVVYVVSQGKLELEYKLIQNHDKPSKIQAPVVEIEQD